VQNERQHRNQRRHAPNRQQQQQQQQQADQNNQGTVNWGAVRQLHDGKWQTRTPTGQVLPELFNTREEATEFLRQRKRIQEQPKPQHTHNRNFNKGDPSRSKKRGGRGNRNNNGPPSHRAAKQHKAIPTPPQPTHDEYGPNNRVPSPPAYIPPMPADLFDDDDEDEDEETDALLEQRPTGREIPSASASDVQRVVLTSSVELRSEYQHGFEEWKPSKPWEHEDVAVRVQVRNEFQKIDRTAIITATGVIYTEKNEDKAINKLPIADVIFTRTVRHPEKPKFLTRLQHAVEHQLAVALYRANFTRMSGETTPMYVFMAQSSGQEIRLQMGKTITNFSGVVPHVKIRSRDEIHLEMVPSEKSFLTKTVRDMMQRGKMKNFFKDFRALVRTSSKLLTVTIVQISDQKSMEAYDPTTNLTVTDMAKLRGAAFTYEDAVVVETTHGLFSSDEIYPSARLNKKEQAARDKQLKKHRYCDRQQAHYEIVVQFKEELWESIRRQDIGLRIDHDLILAPCTYLPEVQVKRSGGPDGESIGSKSRHHEWDRILRKPPAKLKLDNMTVLYDQRFREVKTLKQIFRHLTSRRPWIPYPKFIPCNLNDLCKLWEQRPQSTIRLTTDQNIDKASLEEYFGKFGLISSLSVKGKYGSVQFRTTACVPSILAQGVHSVKGIKVIVEPFLKLSPHQRKHFMPTLSAIQKTQAIMVFLPGREGSPIATMIKNKMTLMINGEEGLNPCALQFVMAGYIKPNSKRALPILQEAIEAGLVPKTGAITFEIDKKKCEFDLVIAIDVSTEHHGQRIASVVATTKPYEGSLSGMKAIVTKVDSSHKIGDLICYDQMKNILKEIGLTGQNILLYRHNACVDSKNLFSHEIQACVDHFPGSHITLVEVTSHTSLRVLDVEYPPIKSKQAKSEFIITQKVTRTCKKCIDFYIRHISKSNPVRYSIVFSTNREILNEDSEILAVAHFTHHLTKNYVHHKDGSKLPGPLKYADHISRFVNSIFKTMCRDNNRLPKFHPKALRPKILVTQ